MTISDRILKSKLQNVYFIWGRGKTTIANRLKEKYDLYVYSTDESRDRQMLLANLFDQPYMCRDFQKEYGVKNFWELPKNVIEEREQHFLREVTPMMIAELLQLSSTNRVILCEGDLDYQAVIPIATHAIYLCNQSTSFDWFSRPDHDDLCRELRSRTDLSEEEKQQIITKAYEIVGANEGVLPDWVVEHGIKSIIWNDQINVDVTVSETAAYFGFDKWVKYK